MSETAAQWVARVALVCKEGCLLWPFSKGSHGYGQIVTGRKIDLAHRYVCRAAHGPAPEGKTQAAHKCGNKLCVAPGHLRWATRSENERDKREHKRDNRGERHGHSKLTASEVLAIRATKNSSADAAKQFGVSAGTILQIRKRERWSWL